MAEKKIIVLTGGIATGKTAVAQMLEELGAYIVDTDHIAHEIVKPNSDTLKKIKEVWGNKVINKDGTLNRKALGKIIFSSKKDRKILNSIMHPKIREVMQNQIKNAPKKVVVVVIPLFFETSTPIKYDEVWLVYCPESMQIERLIKRDGITPKDAKMRIKAQIPIEEKVKRADKIIDNSNSLEDTRKIVESLWKDLS